MHKPTREQQERFDDVNRRLGITADQVKASFKALLEAQRKKHGALTFSSDPIESDIEPIYINVGSIQQLKELVGLPDDSKDHDFPYPPPLTAQDKEIFKNAKSLADFRSNISDTLASKIRKAAEAYVMANSKKVSEYTQMINDTGFPGRLAVFTGDTLDIPANSTYSVTGPDPVVWNYVSINVGANGQIFVQTQLTSTSQTITVQS